MEKLYPVVADKKRFLELLLLADPDESMIDRYLDRGEMFALKSQTHIVGIAVVLSLSDTLCELKNLAIDPAFQRQGYGTLFLKLLFAHYRGRFRQMQVGTSNPLFYQKAGFSPSHVIPGFFTEHYPDPIYEDGVQCIDMIYLIKDL